jgi:iron complex transport system permease protein
MIKASMSQPNTFIKKHWLMLGLFLLVSVLLSLFINLNWEQAPIVLEKLRFPRLCTSIAVGGILALAGVILQTLLSNPLSEPYTLGVASGAALGAAMGSSLHGMATFFGLNLGAIVGAALVLGLLTGFIRRSSVNAETLILLGVMLSFLTSGLLAVWMALADPVGVQSITFWLLGDLSRVELKTAILLCVLALLGTLFFFTQSKKLDAFLFGEKWVESFGVDFKKNQKIGILIISILVGASVSAVGMIGFVGLVVPHFARKIVGARHRTLIPYCVVLGAAALTASDAVARVMGYPHELPVGAITSILGAPVLILILIKNSRGYRP